MSEFVERIAAAVDYLIYEFGLDSLTSDPVTSDHWIEAFSCNPELGKSEGIGDLSGLPISQIWAIAQSVVGSRGGVGWEYLIARGDADRRLY